MADGNENNGDEKMEYSEYQFLQENQKYNDDFLSGGKIYQKLHKSKNLSLTEATATIMEIACKVDYLNKMICEKGQLPFDKLYEEVKPAFESVEELEKFISSMVPIFLHVPGKQNPRCTSDGFRKLVFHIANMLLEKKEVSEANIQQIIQSVHPEIDAKFFKDTFTQKEFYMDFKSLRCLAAQVPCFHYNKEAQKLELVETPDFENSLALWIDILRPRFSPRRDMSRRFCCNAVTTKIDGSYIKGRIVGCGKLSGYGAYIWSRFLDKKSWLENCDKPSKSFIKLTGAITPHDACKITVTEFSSTVIGWNMFDAKNHWGDIDDSRMIYKPKNFEDDSTDIQEPEPEPQSSFTLPDIKTLCEDYDRELSIKRFNNAIAKVGKDAATYENVKKELAKQADESHEEYINWKKLQEAPREFKNIILVPRPDTFEMDSEMRKQLKTYMNEIANVPARPSLQKMKKEKKTRTNN